MLCFSRLGQVGRLGNQLFQVAFITYFAKKHGIDYQMPFWKYADYFDYEFNFVDQEIQARPFDLIIKEPALGYHEDFFINFLPQIRTENVDIITGYFQSYKYFSKSHVLQIFKPSNKFTPEKINVSKSVAVSVRRGDFVKHSDYNNIEAPIFLDLLKQFPDFKVYIFSDDYKYCKANFIGSQFEFMEGLNDIEQLLTLRQFEYFLLSNSTFSYWGPMLSSSPKKVYYPYYMFPSLDRCKLYNEYYWPDEPETYISYRNPINKPLL